MRSETAAGVRRPDLGVVAVEKIARPEIPRRATGIVHEVSRIERGIAFVIDDAECLLRRGQSPVGVAREIERGRARACSVPRHLAAVGLLPHEAADVVCHGAVGIVGERWGIDRVVAVFAEGGRGVQRLAGIGEPRHAPRRHRVVVEARGVGVGGVHRAARTLRGLRDRVRDSVDRVRDIVRRATERVGEHIRILRRPREAGDDGTRERRSRGRDGAGRGLWIDLPAIVPHRAVHGIHQIRIRRRPCAVARIESPARVVVITPRPVIVSAIGVERLHRAAIRLHVSIDRIPIERPRAGFVRREHRVEMRRRDVIVVVIRAPAMPAVRVEFADRLRKLPRVVARIENRNAIRAERHRAAEEIARKRDRRGRSHRHERDAPDIRLAITQRSRVRLRVRDIAKVAHRNRQLLLPRGDPHHRRRHQRRIRHRVALDVKVGGVVVKADVRFEGRKRRGHQRAIPGGWRG